RILRQHAARHHPRDDEEPRVRATGPRDRPRRTGLHGAEEAGGLLLMRRTTAQAGSPEDADLRVNKTLLRFNTCGSVDDGKSTLIGRLLWESKAIADDQI